MKAPKVWSPGDHLTPNKKFLYPPYILLSSGFCWPRRVAYFAGPKLCLPLRPLIHTDRWTAPHFQARDTTGGAAPHSRSTHTLFEAPAEAQKLCAVFILFKIFCFKILEEQLEHPTIFEMMGIISILYPLFFMRAYSVHVLFVQEKMASWTRSGPFAAKRISRGSYVGYHSFFAANLCPYGDLLWDLCPYNQHRSILIDNHFYKHHFFKL